MGAALVALIGAIAPIPWPVTLTAATVTLCALPGMLIVSLLGLDRSSVRWPLAVGLSSVFATVGALVMITFSVWQPIPAFACLVLGSGSWLLMMMLRHPNPGLPRIRRQPVHRSALVWFGCLAVSLVVFALGLVATPAELTGDKGLVTTYSTLVWVGLIAVIVLAALSATASRRLGATASWAGVLATVFVLHAPGVFLSPAARLPWTYKHIGVVDYITQHGGVNPYADIYHNWPGAFAVMAWLQDLCGAPYAGDYAAFTPLIVNTLLAMFVYGLALRLRLSRTTRNLAMLVAVLANWVSQDYYSPQAWAYLLYLAGLLWILSLKANAHFALPRLLRQNRKSGQPSPWHRAIPARGPVWVQDLVMAAVWLAIISSHQITPLFLMASLGLMLVFGVTSVWRWLAIGLVLFGGYLAWRWAYVGSSYSIGVSGVDIAGNLSTRSELTEGIASAAAIFAALTSRGLTALLLICAGAAVVLLSVRRRIGDLVVPTILSVAPAGVALVQSYGGEVIFRVVLFALPGLSILTALGLGELIVACRDSSRLRRAAISVSVVVCLAMGLLFQGAMYGLERAFRVYPKSVQLARLSVDALPKGSIIFAAVLNYPSRPTSGYVLHLSRQSAPDRSIFWALSDPHFRDLSVRVAYGTANITPKGACSFILFTPEMRNFVGVYHSDKLAKFDQLRNLLRRDDKHFQVLRSTSDTLLLQNKVPGRSDETGLPGVGIAPSKCVTPSVVGIS
ncbi:MAG: hypothetical protein IPI32_14990 [Austwickia sp.]|nr:hypothetical protein [Austwickia sp.]MBK9100941.1 hypothetical protein [Austwickia sp.]